jgi:hypothetical protein
MSVAIENQAIGPILRQADGSLAVLIAPGVWCYASRGWMHPAGQYGPQTPGYVPPATTSKPEEK